MQNYFALFQLPEQFLLDRTALDQAYHEVQGQVHPDRFTGRPDAEKRVAMQWATQANEAYRTLKSPFKRAAYLCELNGVDLETESNTSMPAEFLMQQMEWREALDEARVGKDLPALEQLENELRQARERALTHTGELLHARDFAQAGQLVRQLMFLEKFDEEIQHSLETLQD